VDRYGSEICLAVKANQPVPSWVVDALPDLPGQMLRSDQRAHQADRAVVDATEAWLLQQRVGETFTATVIDADPNAGTVVLDDPPVRARCEGSQLPVGQTIRVRLTIADVSARTVHFERAA
jgi:exoribonuclease R